MAEAMLLQRGDKQQQIYVFLITRYGDGEKITRGESNPRVT